jgi:hypothetical protein
MQPERWSADHRGETGEEEDRGEDAVMVKVHIELDAVVHPAYVKVLVEALIGVTPEDGSLTIELDGSGA